MTRKQQLPPGAPAPDDRIGTMDLAAQTGMDRRSITRWADTGRLGPVWRTPGGHRVLSRAAIAERYPAGLLTLQQPAAAQDAP